MCRCCFHEFYAILRIFAGLLLYNAVVANGEYHFILFLHVVTVIFHHEIHISETAGPGFDMEIGEVNVGHGVTYQFDIDSPFISLSMHFLQSSTFRLYL